MDQCGNDLIFSYSTTPLTTFTNAGVVGHGWSEDTGQVQDSGFNRERGANEYQKRGGAGECPGNLKNSANFNMVVDKSDPMYDVLVTAINNNDVIAAAETNEPIGTAGGKGWAGNFRVTQANETNPVDNASTMAVNFSAIQGQVVDPFVDPTV